MAKKKSRAIPYRVYKKMFLDCPAYDYANGKITVDFPEDYLNSKMYTPEGWNNPNGTRVSKLMGRDAGNRQVWADVAQYADGGCNHYSAYVTIGNTFCGGSIKEKHYFRNFDAAVAWAVQTAETIIKQ
jgi:hypothetical protein